MPRPWRGIDVHIRTVSISNFRRLDGLTVTLDGEDIVLTGPNGSGKTSFLVAVAGALGQRINITRDDFLDLAQPIEIRVVLGGLVAADQQVFGDRVTLGGAGGSAQLSVGLIATWDDDTERADVRSGFPTSSWQSLSRQQREALPAVWLPAWRDPARLLSVTARASFLAEFLSGLDLDAANAQALVHLADAITALTSAPDLVSGLQDAATQLGRLLPDVDPNALSMSRGTEQDLWATLRLAVEHEGPPTDVRTASSGLAQATIFAVVLQLLTARPRIVLVDEPEISLHPSAQRAVVRRLGEAATQIVVATHSSNVLDRVDIRRIARMEPSGTQIVLRQPTGVGDVDARRYARLVDPRASEAVFARTVVVVEGPSDRLAFVEVCATLGVDLDASGIVVLALDGAKWITIATHVYGPPGLAVPMLGLVDADHESAWMRALTDVGLTAASRPDLEGHGFFVCDPDLEPVLVDELGETTVENIINADGAGGQLQRFAQQPSYSGLARRDQLVGFIKKDKTRWAPLLAAQLSATAQTPLHELARRL
jgi:energy-coupling factor transporter ATP-binding protein EcfA2